MITPLCVIILNYNRPQDTQKCIQFIKKSDFPTGSKIIIVNNSQDPAIKLKLEKTKKIDKLIQSPRNLGFAKGNNLGIKYALIKYQAKKILIINPDVIVPKIFFSPLIKSLDRLPHAGLIAPAHKHQQKDKFFYGLGGSIDWKIAKCTHTNKTKINFKKNRKYDFVSFACVLIKRKVFKKIGLLDERYFMYLEDVDYCLKAQKYGFDCYINPNIIVQHKTSSSFPRPTAKLKYSFISSIKFINKHLPPISRVRPWIYTLLFYPYLYLLWTYHGLKNKN